MSFKLEDKIERFEPKEAYYLMTDYLHCQCPENQAEFERHQTQIEKMVEYYKLICQRLPDEQKGITIYFISLFKRVKEILKREKEIEKQRSEEHHFSMYNLHNCCIGNVYKHRYRQKFL